MASLVSHSKFAVNNLHYFVTFVPSFLSTTVDSREGGVQETPCVKKIKIVPISGFGSCLIGNFRKFIELIRNRE